MSSEEVRRKVANSWASRFEKKSDQSQGKRKREDEPAEEEPMKKTKMEVIEIITDEEEVEAENKDKKEVIELESEDDTDEGTPEVTHQTKELPKSGIHQPPFLPIHNPTYDNPKLPNSITASDVLSSPRLRSCYVFSYQFQLEFILPLFHRKIIDLSIVCQEGTVLDWPGRIHYPNIQFLKVHMQPFTSHHPKLIVNVYDDDTVQLFLASANMTVTEWETNNQMIWTSPVLHKTIGAEVSSSFKTHLFQYLKNYNIPQLNTLIMLLKRYDFSSIKGDFVSSATSKSNQFGYLGLFNALLANGLIPNRRSLGKKTRKLVYQTSSMGSAIRFSDNNQTSANIFTHLILPLVSGKYDNFYDGKLNLSSHSKDFPLPNGMISLQEFMKEYRVVPYIIFPSLSDVRQSFFGYLSGGWSHYNPFSKWNTPMNWFLRKVFFHHSYTTQRKTNPSHTKFLVMSSDNFKTLDWIFFTSANMSKQAWGNVPKRDELSNPRSTVSNYETGILLSPKDYGPQATLVPLEIGQEKQLEKDQVPIILPFQLPPKKYSNNDEPWCISVPHDEPDFLGRCHTT